MLVPEDIDKTISGNTEGAILAGRYRVVRQLGQGGMGSVWLAEDTQLDNKRFAIKMLPSILVSNKRAYRQLKDEALVAMRLVHPNIVQIRAFEENNGNPFLVMDYIEGQTLDDYLAEHWDVSRRDAEAQSGRADTPRPPQGGLPESDVIRILKPIAAALDYAHSRGVIHGDVKPGNIMIAKDGTPFLLDFGIASESDGGHHEEDAPSGTRRYMAPDRLEGAAPSSVQDVYSFAATVRECLRGELPQGVAAALSRNPADRPATCMKVFEAVPGTDSRRAAPIGIWKVVVLFALVVALAVAVSSWLQSGGARPPEAPEKAGQDGSKPAETNTKDVATNTPPIPHPVATNTLPVPPPVATNTPPIFPPVATNTPPIFPPVATNTPPIATNEQSVLPPVDDKSKRKADDAKELALEAKKDAEDKIAFPIATDSDLYWSWFTATNKLAEADAKYCNGEYHSAAAEYRKAENQFIKIKEKLNQ